MNAPDAGQRALALDSVDLVRRYRAGEAAALQRLFERYYERVHRIVRVRMGAHLRQRQDSLDLVQGTFVAAIEALDRFEPAESGQLIHWLATIAENQIRGAHDQQYAQRRDPRRERALEGIRSALASGELRLEPIAADPSPSERLQSLEEAQRLDDRVGRLATDHREVILLRDYAGSSWSHVSEVMGRSPEASMMLHKRARLALLREYQRDAT